MTARSEDIRRKLREMSRGNESTFIATVKSVNEDEKTCVVATSEDISYNDVRLKAVVDAEKPGFCFVPKVDSTVLVARIGGSNNLYVALFSEIEKIDFGWQEDLTITFDTEMLSIKWGEDTEATMTADDITLKTGERTMVMNGDTITFNEGAKSSYATDINALVEKLNAIENDINSLKQVFTTWIPAPMDGGAVLKGAAASWAGQLIQPVTSVDDLKDETIIH